MCHFLSACSGPEPCEGAQLGSIAANDCRANRAHARATSLENLRTGWSHEPGRALPQDVVHDCTLKCGYDGTALRSIVCAHHILLTRCLRSSHGRTRRLVGYPRTAATPPRPAPPRRPSRQRWSSQLRTAVRSRMRRAPARLAHVASTVRSAAAACGAAPGRQQGRPRRWRLGRRGRRRRRGPCAPQPCCAAEPAAAHAPVTCFRCPWPDGVRLARCEPNLPWPRPAAQMCLTTCSQAGRLLAQPNCCTTYVQELRR